MKRGLPRIGVLAAMLLAAMLVGVLACASTTPPVERVDAAGDAIAAAEGAGAYQHAPLDLHMARERLDQAKQALAKEQFARARRLAEISKAHAELARRKADAAKNERAAEQLEAEIEVVERDLGGQMR